jgi:hypothetical protein
MHMTEAGSSVLLWSAAIVVSVISGIAFVLWGTGGAVMLFDMVVALCT